jgi:hypothetical protein
MRYRLRTLLILLALMPPALAWLWMTPEWDRYQSARTIVQARTDEVARARAVPAPKNGSVAAIRYAAAVRHAELRYVRADADARRKSVLYRFLAPKK